MSTFAQTLLFQVKPDQLEAFEMLMADIRAAQEKLPGCISARYMKRFYIFDDVNAGEAPRMLTKVVKCVKYYGFLEFDSIESCGQATAWLFARYGKEIMKLLIMPFDIHSGYTV
ncbi:MAG: hypothetical protein IJ438_01320 [Clostridia bacterium]|nr:hypothetical protein [Clostridia bacterium]